jgi:hypothetical protein
MTTDDAAGMDQRPTSQPEPSHFPNVMAHLVVTLLLVAGAAIAAWLLIGG